MKHDTVIEDSPSDADFERRGFLAMFGSAVVPSCWAALRGASAGMALGATTLPAANVSKLRATVVSRNRVTRGEARHRAFPGLLRLDDGTLLIFYREGTNHWKTDDSVLKLTRSTDGGKTWSDSQTLLMEKGWGFAAHHGPALLSDGSILAPAVALRHHQGPFFDFRVFAMRSVDSGRKWDIQQVGPLPGWVWQNQYGRVLEIDGELWLPGGGQREGDETWYNGFFVSRDNGKTWPQWREVAAGRNEKDILELPDGRLLAMIRGLKQTLRSYSTDRGQTWSKPEKLDLFGQSPCLLSLPNGVILFAYRQVRPKSSYGVGLAVCDDNGRTWRELAPLYVSAGKTKAAFDCGYPSMALDESGDVLCAYYTTFKKGDCHIEIARIKIVEGSPIPSK